nr:acyl-CoA desaturase [Nocardioidaceae bacterium]
MTPGISAPAPPAVTYDPATDITTLSGALGSERQSMLERVALAVFIALPFAAVVAAVPVAWGGWLGWHDVAIALVFYLVTGLGITAGFHRLFTHKAYKPNRALKIAMAIA